MEFTSKPEERSEGTDAWERAREKAADSDKRVEGRKSMVKIVRGDVTTCAINWRESRG